MGLTVAERLRFLADGKKICRRVWTTPHRFIHIGPLGVEYEDGSPYCFEGLHTQDSREWELYEAPEDRRAYYIEAMRQNAFGLAAHEARELAELLEQGAAAEASSEAPKASKHTRTFWVNAFSNGGVDGVFDTAAQADYWAEQDESLGEGRFKRIARKKVTISFNEGEMDE